MTILLYVVNLCIKSVYCYVELHSEVFAVANKNKQSTCVVKVEGFFCQGNLK